MVWVSELLRACLEIYMVLQVELATGEFPYKDCKTDFEVLTKVLQDDPPLLTPGPAYSHELCSFIRDWLVIAFISLYTVGFSSSERILLS